MLMDSSKVGTILPFTFAKADDVDVFISDSDLPESVKEYFNQPVFGNSKAQMLNARLDYNNNTIKQM